MHEKIFKTGICKECGKEFEMYGSPRITLKFCSPACQCLHFKDLKQARYLAARKLKEFYRLRDVIRKLESEENNGNIK